MWDKDNDRNTDKLRDYDVEFVSYRRQQPARFGLLQAAT